MPKLLPLLVCLTALFPTAALAAPTALEYEVKVGPKDERTCKVTANLFKPDGATADRPAAAVLATNGFGGSKADFDVIGESYRKHGYVFLAYSGLGFGGSGCEIYLDDRDWDGKAAKQLVTELGKLDYVLKDKAGDPRVGMIGGSYGGQIQFAAAGIDPRIDTIVPAITWNDLSYSLAPNNTSQTTGVSSATPGVAKFQWTSLFFALGIARGVEFSSVDPARNEPPCPNFADQACTTKAHMDTTGYADEAGVAFARHASVASFLADIDIPVMLSQAQADTLFNLNEAVATYEALRAQGTPVKMLWRNNGHSPGAIQGESDQKNPEGAYESRMTLEWLDYYLRGFGDKPKLDFSFYRDWIEHKGDAQPAVGSAPAYPASGARTLFLSGGDALVDSRGAVKAGTANFAVPSVGAPTSYTEVPLDQSLPVTDTAGTFAAFATPALTEDLDVAGIPKVTLSLDAPVHAAAGGADDGAKLVLFVKLYDVAPDGTIDLPHRLIAPVRVPDPTKPVTVTLPGIVHRFAKGHRLQLVVAAGDAAYKGNNLAGPVTVKVGAEGASALELPVLGTPFAAGAKPAVQAAGSGRPASVQTPAAAPLPKARACAKNRRVIVVKGKGLRRVTVNGKAVRVRKGRARVDLRKRAAGSYRVLAVARRGGKERRSSRTYRVC